MALQDFVDKLPEDVRDAYKAELDGVAVIRSREDAKKLFESNAFVRSEKDALVSITTENYSKKFQEEKLPGLLEAEYKKRNPDADPKDIETKNLREALEKMQRDMILKDRKADAVAKLAAQGIPVELAEFAIDADETAYGSKIEKLTGLKAWLETEVQKKLAEKLGNQGSPRGGGSGQVDFSKMTQTEVMQYAQKGKAEEAEVLEWAKKRK